MGVSGWGSGGFPGMEENAYAKCDARVSVYSRIFIGSFIVCHGADEKGVKVGFFWGGE